MPTAFSSTSLSLFEQVYQPPKTRITQPTQYLAPATAGVKPTEAAGNSNYDQLKQYIDATQRTPNQYTITSQSVNILDNYHLHYATKDQQER